LIDPIKRRDTKKALAKIQVLAEKYIAQGMSKEDARDRAYREARDNPRMSIKRYKKKATAVKRYKKSASPKR